MRVVDSMPTEMQPSSQADSDARLIEVIRKIRHQKQKPTVDRICHALLRDHDIELSLDAVECLLNDAVGTGVVTRISTNGGAISYREPTEQSNVSTENSSTPQIKRSVATCSSTLGSKGKKSSQKSKESTSSSADVASCTYLSRPANNSDADVSVENIPIAASPAGRRKPLLKVEKETDLSNAVLVAIERLEVASGKTLEKEIRCHYSFEVAPGADVRHRIRVACKHLVEQRRLVKDGSVFQMASTTEAVESPSSQDATGTGYLEETDFNTKLEDNEDLMTSSIFVCSGCKAIEEDRTNVISCAECGVDRHTKCMSRAARSLLKSVQLWLCQTCQPCPICLTSSRTRKQRSAGLLVCELCDQVYHPECCNNHLQTKSKDSWICPKCQLDNNSINTNSDVDKIKTNVHKTYDKDSEANDDRLSPDKLKKTVASRNRSSTFDEHGQTYQEIVSDDAGLSCSEGSPNASPNESGQHTLVSVNGHCVTNPESSGTHLSNNRRGLMNPQVKLTPLRNGDTSETMGEDTSSVDTSSSTQRKRSKNVQLSSLFDSLTQFFSTTSDRRRRTPFVSSFVSDISATAWWKSSQKSVAHGGGGSGGINTQGDTALSSADKSSSNKSQVISRKSDPVKPTTNAVLSKAAARHACSYGVPPRRRQLKERRCSLTSETETSSDVKWIDVTDGHNSKRGRRRDSVDDNLTDYVRKESRCSSIDKPTAVTTGVVTQKTKGLSNNQKLMKVDSVEIQKRWKTKCQDHQQLTENVVEGRVTDSETKLFIMSQTIAQQRLLVSEGIYILDEEADKNPVIVLGKYELCTTVALPRATEFISSSKLYICEFCFKWSISRAMLRRHLAKCSTFYPPGWEIYRHNNLSVYEVDGQRASSYCSSLSLFARLLVGDETVCSFPASQHCLYYVLRRNDSIGSHLIGYFTKVTVQPRVLAMLCAGYQLCKLTSSVGSLPLLLSDPLTAKLNSYLKSTILDDLIKHRMSNGQCTVDGISCRTAITIEDVLATLSSLHVPIDSNTGAVNANITKLRECARRFNIDFKPQIAVDPGSIRSMSFDEETKYASQTLTSEPMKPATELYTQMSGLYGLSFVTKKLPVVKKCANSSIRAPTSQKVLNETIKPSGRPSSRRAPVVNPRQSKLVATNVSGRQRHGFSKSSNSSAGSKSNQNYLSRVKKLGNQTTSAAKRLRPRNTKLKDPKQIPEAMEPSTPSSNSSPERSTPSPVETPVKKTNLRRPISKSKSIKKKRQRQSGVILRRSPRMGATAVILPDYGPIRADEITDDETGDVVEVAKSVNSESLIAAGIDAIITPSAELLEREPTQKSVPREDHRITETDTEDELVDVLEDNHSYGCKTPSTDIDRCDYPLLDQSLNEDQLPKLTADVKIKQTAAMENSDEDDKELPLSDAGSVGLTSPLIVDTSPQQSVDQTNDNQVEPVQNETGNSSSYGEKTNEEIRAAETLFTGRNWSSENNLRMAERPQVVKNRASNRSSDTNTDIPTERSSCLKLLSGTEQSSAPENSTRRGENRQHAIEVNSQVINREAEVKLGMMWRDGRFSTDMPSSSLERTNSFNTVPEHENLFLPRQTASATNIMLPVESRKRSHEDYISNCQPAAKHSPLSADWESRSTPNSLALKGAPEMTSRGIVEMHGGRSSVPKFDSGGSSCNSNSSLSKFGSADLTVLDSGYRTADVERPASTMSADRGIEPVRTHKGSSSSITDRYSRGLGYGVMSPLDTQSTAALASGRYLPGAVGSHGNSAHRQRSSGGSTGSQLDQQQRLSHVWSSNPVPAHQHPSTHLQHLEDLPYGAPPKGHIVPSVPTPPSLSMTPPIVRMTPPPSATPDAAYARTCQQQQQQPQRQHNRQHHKAHKQTAPSNTHPSTNTPRSAASPQFAVTPAGVTGTRGRASPSFSAPPAGYDMFSAACHMQQPIGYFGHHQGAPALQMGVVGLTHAQMAVAAAANFGQQMHAAATAGAQPNSAAYSAAAAAAYNYLNGAGLQPFNVDINSMMRR